MRGQFCRLRCRESLTTPRGAAACVAFEAGAIAYQSEILTFGAGFPLIALHAGLLHSVGCFLCGAAGGHTGPAGNRSDIGFDHRLWVGCPHGNGVLVGAFD